MKSKSCRLLLSIGIIAVWITSPPIATADHRDATAVLDDPRTNINDVYAFVNQNSGNVVLAMTVNGFTVPGVKPTFAPACLYQFKIVYQFKIDNTGDFIEDLVIQFAFDAPVGPAYSPTQGFTIVGPVKPPKAGNSNTLAKPKASANAGPFFGLVNNTDSSHSVTANNMNVFCGLRDDPLFFDEAKIRASMIAVGPPAVRVPGVDYYAGLNCSVIAIEVPASLLKNALGENVVNIWATTNVAKSVARTFKAPARGEPLVGRESTAKTFVQHDRGALAVVSTFLVAEEDKNAFCAGQPKDDTKFFELPARTLVQHFQIATINPTATDNYLATRFPDVLRLDVTGAANGNGRRPDDDVIDLELTRLTAGGGLTDNVNANDVAFFTDFPFFAPGHTAHEGVPPRN